MEAVIGHRGKHGARERQEEGLPQDLARKSPLHFFLPKATKGKKKDCGKSLVSLLV